jgi:DNA-directed RNA polymerase specialized sigma24 family protein
MDMEMNSTNIRNIETNLNGECKMDVWLCQIAKHLWFRELEKRKKHRTIDLEKLENEPDDGPSMR